MCVVVKVGTQMIHSAHSTHCVIVCCLVVGLQSSHGPIVETEIPYSRKRKVPFPRLFHRKTPFRFCFRFRIKNSISISILQISIFVSIFPLRFHFFFGKTKSFHSIFIPSSEVQTRDYQVLTKHGGPPPKLKTCFARL